jgi:hypothetical protein
MAGAQRAKTGPDGDLTGPGVADHGPDRVAQGVIMRDHSHLERLGLSRFLFIYRVEESGHGGQHFCTVVSYGRNLRAAEQVAINRVHQQGLHIVRTDTATPAPWLDPVSDQAYLAELEQFGSALQVA